MGVCVENKKEQSVAISKNSSSAPYAYGWGKGLKFLNVSPCLGT
jgi:hypothetical protein